MAGILGDGFNTDNVDDAGFDPVPAGDYKMIVTKTEEKKTKAGTGMYLQIEFTIHGGQFNGRKLWSRFNLVNENQTAVNIAKSELKQLCLAVNKKQIRDAVELMDLVFIGRVVLAKNKETGDDRNEIKKYLPVNGTPPAPTSVPSATTSAGPAPGSKPAWAR